MSGQSQDTATLASLADHAAIRDLLAAYCEHLDAYEIEAVGALFTELGVMDQGPGRGGPIAGRQAIVAGMLERQAVFRRTHHQLGQSRITCTGDTAQSVTYVTAWHQRWDGSVVVARLRYEDELVRQNGGWRIQQRVSRALGVEGFQEAQWNWLERLPPAGQGRC